MVCPKCGSEYRPGFYKCSDCGVGLVASMVEGFGSLEYVPPPPESDNAELDLVTVFKSGDPVLIAMARSLLNSAGIPFITPGGGTNELFGKHNPIMGPVQFQVNREDAKDATLLLEDLDEPTGEESRTEDEDD